MNFFRHFVRSSFRNSFENSFKNFSNDSFRNRWHSFHVFLQEFFDGILQKTLQELLLIYEFFPGFPTEKFPQMLLQNLKEIPSEIFFKDSLGNFFSNLIMYFIKCSINVCGALLGNSSRLFSVISPTIP